MGIRTGGTPLIAQLEAGSEGIVKAPGAGEAGVAPPSVSSSEASPSAVSVAPASTPPLGGGVSVAGAGGGVRASPSLTVLPGSVQVDGASRLAPCVGSGAAGTAAPLAVATGTASAAVAAAGPLDSLRI